MAIHLIIKGNVAQAIEAARNHGISLNQAHGPFCETQARCADDYRERVVAWFAEEPRQAPYPVGTLLLFTDY